jgi:hypothetical protein
VQKWEYKVVGVRFRMGGGMEKVLNEHGREGWELVFVSRERLLFFKRPAS